MNKYIINFVALFSLISSNALAESNNNITIDKEKLDIPDWAKRVEIELDLSSTGKPEYSLLSIQPIYQSPDKTHTFFNQSRAAYGNNGRTTGNIGFGYRTLALDKKLLLGINSFYDYEFPYDHQRASLGLEARSYAFELNGNIYEGLTDWKDGENGSSEKAADGHDVEVGMQLPYLPWTKIYAKSSRWNMESSGAKDIRSKTYSIQLTPLPYVEISAGHNRENGGSISNFVETRLSFMFGQKYNAMSSLIDSQMFRFDETMEDYTLHKVRRQNTIRVEQVNGVSASVSIGRGN